MIVIYLRLGHLSYGAIYSFKSWRLNLNLLKKNIKKERINAMGQCAIKSREAQEERLKIKTLNCHRRFENAIK